VTQKHQSDDQLISIGGYTPSDAERLLDALAQAHIEFRVECDDGIRPDLALQWSFGEHARIRVFVHRGKVTEVREIQARLFENAT